MKIWHYYFPNDKPGEGWAHIYISENGTFAAVSDWGHYAYMWPRSGTEDFRAFFTNAEAEWAYFANKLCPEKILNEAKSWERLKRELLAMRHRKDLTEEKAREAWDAIGYYTSWEEYIESSECNKVFDEPWDFSVHEHDPGVVSFCKRVMPQLAAVLSAELSGNKLHLGNINEVILGKRKGFYITRQRVEAAKARIYRRLPLRSVLREGWLEASCDIRGDKAYPHHFPWSGTRRDLEYFVEALKFFEGQAEIAILWSCGEMTGYSLDNHVVTEHSVAISLVK